MRILVLLVALLIAPIAQAVEPQEMLSDPALEARARVLSAGLRCVVCRNQSIDDSNAPLAADLRVLLRERLVAGDSDDQAVAFLVERYGSYILLKPPVTTATLALWIGPVALLLLALGGFGAVWMRGRRAAASAADAPADTRAPEPDLTDEDKALIASILNGDLRE
ncbi:cytochrome c-type biogenesis protein [Actibacterium sp.]|uniref:cytochrome c-type biogenesis protein n=1 Tax=Actibacterium sp. TaxID=1872125 RepID=UPI00356699F9